MFGCAATPEPMIQNNKDWNTISASFVCGVDLEPEPMIQNNKDWNNRTLVSYSRGQKPEPMIQNNKDWNLDAQFDRLKTQQGPNQWSKTTRIETSSEESAGLDIMKARTNDPKQQGLKQGRLARLGSQGWRPEPMIQNNKDWNILIVDAT